MAGVLSPRREDHRGDLPAQKHPRPGTFVPFDQRLWFPIQEGPLGAKFFIAGGGGMTVMRFHTVFR